MAIAFETAAPAQLTKPGEILRDELEARGWENKDLAEVIGRPEQAISQIITGKKAITEETAIQLGQALGVDPGFWVGLEKQYRLQQALAKDQNSDIPRRARLRELLPCQREITNRGWLPRTANLDILESAIREFLKIQDLAEAPELALCLRQGRTKSPDKGRRQLVWARRVEQLAEQETPPKYDRRALAAAMPKLLRLAEDPDSVGTVPQFLHELGIAFLILPKIDKTHLEGGAWPERQTPIIALTLRYDRLDNFWFNLLHELGHLHHQHKGVILDSEDDSQGTDQCEQEANAFAQQWLRREEIEAFLGQQGRYPKREKVISLAQDLRLHPAIVIGQIRRITDNHRIHKALDEKVRHRLAPWIEQ